MPKLAEFINVQSSDLDFRTAFLHVGDHNTGFSERRNELLVRVLSLHGTSRRLARISLGSHLLGLRYYSLFIAYRGERRMYDPMRKDFYCPPMASDVHATMHICRFSAKNSRQNKTRWQIKLFFLEGSFEYFETYILGPISEKARQRSFGGDKGSVYQSEAISTVKISATTVMCISLEHWVAKFGNLSKQLADDIRQFVMTIFVAV